MNTITIAEKKLNVSYDVDVLVVGGGPGGVGAAIAAARNNKKVLLIEKKAFLGGMMTGGLVHVFEDMDLNLFRGINIEILDRMRKRNSILNDAWMGCFYEPEHMKLVLDELVHEAGVQVLFHTTFVDAICENNTTKGAIITSINGTEVVRAKVVIDCTRTATVAKSAGAEMLVNDPEYRDGYMTRFTVRNVDYGKIFHLLHENPDFFWDATSVQIMPDVAHGGRHAMWYMALMGGDQTLQAAAKRGEFTFDTWSTHMLGYIDKDSKMELLLWVPNNEAQWTTNKGNCVGVYCDEVDQYDMSVYSEGERHIREQADALTNHLRKNVPGFENVALDLTSDETCVFVTHMKGKHIINKDEMLYGANYDDSVAIGNWFLDYANGRIHDCVPHDIPYGAFYSVNIDNLLAGGYCMSADVHGAWSVLSQVTCLQNGQVAGTAAALAIDAGVAVKELNVKVLQKRLKEQDMVTCCKDVPPEVIKEYHDAAERMRARRASGEPDQKVRMV